MIRLDCIPADWWLSISRNASRTWWATNGNGMLSFTRSNTPLRLAGAHLRAVGSYTVLGPITLPAGEWSFSFAVDENQDGIYDGSFGTRVN